MPAPDNQPRSGISRKSFLQLGGALVAAGVAPPFAASAARAATTSTAAAASSAAATGGPIMTDGGFPVGLFWPPPPTETTVERYREIAEAGFTFVHGGNYANGDVQITTQMLRVAEEAGVGVLVEDPDIKWLLHNMNVGDPAQPFTISEDELRQRITAAVNRYAPAWRAVEGRLHISSGSGDGSIGWIEEGSGWKDYTFGFDTEPLRTGAGGYAQAGWAFRIQDERNAYVWLLSTQGAGGMAVLKKAVFVGGSPVVTSVPLPYQLEEGKTYHVETTLSGSTFTTRIDGVVVDTTTDTTYAAGSAGFREAGSESAYFDNVTVTGAGGTTLFSDGFDSGLGAWRLPAGTGYGSFAGIHLYDEPSVGQLPLMAKAVAMANDAYPDALSYVNLLPGFGAGYEQAARDLDSAVISFDRYPIVANGEDLGYFDNWAQVRAAALKHGRDSWVFIQSVGYANHAIPTKADLLWQISISLAYGCKGIQYFTYWTPRPGPRRSVHDRSDHGRRQADQTLPVREGRQRRVPGTARQADAWPHLDRRPGRGRTESARGTRTVRRRRSGVGGHRRPGRPRALRRRRGPPTRIGRELFTPRARPRTPDPTVGDRGLRPRARPLGTPAKRRAGTGCRGGAAAAGAVSSEPPVDGGGRSRALASWPHDGMLGPAGMCSACA